MMKQVVIFVLLLSIVFLIGAPTCLAKTKGYLYVVSYSVVHKKVFLSNVIVQNVRDISYSDEEFVAEVELIQKMEAQFQKHLISAGRATPSEFTTAARGAYKSRAIADRRINAEREQFAKKGYSVEVLSDFIYSD